MNQSDDEKKVVIPSLSEIEDERLRYHIRKRYGRIIRNTIGTLLVVAAIAILVASLILPVFRTTGSSMNPTLDDGQIVVSLNGSKFDHGDIVSFYIGNKVLVKRVIAGPGEWVDIDRKGNVFVDGQLIDENYVLEKAFGKCDISFPLQVGKNQWFLLGDNRENSVDSRLTEVGCVTKEQIIGRVFFRVWPLSKFGFVH